MLTLSAVHFFKHSGHFSKGPVWVAPLTKLHSVLISHLGSILPERRSCTKQRVCHLHSEHSCTSLPR